MKDQRIDIKLKGTNALHQQVMAKLQSYDKRMFYCQTDYILRAILAYQPAGTDGEELRRVIREELERYGRLQTAQGEGREEKTEEKTEEGPRVPEQGSPQEAQPEERGEQEELLKPETLDIMKSLGVDLDL